MFDSFVGTVKNIGGKSAVGVQGGGMTTSFWGLRGTEDLGGGYSSFFVLESYFQPQNGTYGRYAGDSFFSRNAYVGISSPYGSVRAGRLTTQFYIATVVFNPFFNSFTFSPVVLGVLKGQGVQTLIGDTAWNNAVAYSSPTLGGVKFDAMYAFGNQAGESGQRKWSAGVSYAQGGLSASAVYQYINFSANPGDISTAVSGVAGLRSQGAFEVAVSYDAKFVKGYLQYIDLRDNAALGHYNTQTGQIGASVPVGVGAVLASYSYSRSAVPLGTDGVRNIWTIGYDYPLSKRTDLYAAFKSDRYTNLSSGMAYGVGIRSAF